MPSPNIILTAVTVESSLMPSAARSAASFSHTLHLRPLAFALFGLSFCTLPGMAGAQVVVAGGNTKVYQAPNGVAVVDIATANAAGVSHNVYSQFNVARTGMVLNNGDSTQMTRQSQLAGQVGANMNLNGGAKVILNEVRGTSRSTLAGHMEVLGSRRS
jgi:filamentous hemagglutinin